MKRNENRKQTYLYRGKEYSFRIDSASLRKMERETGKRAYEINMGTKEGMWTILYYCTCWKEDKNSLETFLRDCRIGMAVFRPGKREYTSVGLYRLFATKIQEYEREGKL
ncbi:MAG: hypothetical protein K2J82_07815 [Muribaculaceae bacterium]|nr:hypothetical protein [Muribaculaceae bacterium]